LDCRGALTLRHDVIVPGFGRTEPSLAAVGDGVQLGRLEVGSDALGKRARLRERLPRPMITSAPCPSFMPWRSM
jgi:hypothetical protein